MFKSLFKSIKKVFKKITDALGPLFPILVIALFLFAPAIATWMTSMGWTVVAGWVTSLGSLLSGLSVWWKLAIGFGVAYLINPDTATELAVSAGDLVGDVIEGIGVGASEVIGGIGGGLIDAITGGGGFTSLLLYGIGGYFLYSYLTDDDKEADNIYIAGREDAPDETRFVEDHNGNY